ncbi:MAG: flagellar motor switch protein FliG [Firmicutes bacterium]|nr:flagellar motor switch protein FliG [Bacillota bacterium]
MARQLSGKMKAAILLVAFGPEIAAGIFKHLNESEIETLTLEIANLRKVDSNLRDKVLEEFSQLYQAQEYISQGGIDYAREILEKALGPRKAADIIEKLTETLQIRPFDFARNTDPAQLINFIQNEHPQTISLVLSYLNPEQAAVILSALDPEKQVDVARRIAIMDRTSPEVLTELENLLEKKISTYMTQGYLTAGGIGTVVDILNRVDRGTEKTILETLSEEDPDLAEEIKRRMFVFEDIILLDDRAIQQVLREVDSKDLALALKTASEEVANRIYKNMSKRASEMLKEDIQFMGPVRLRDAEDAQQRIVNVIRKLEEAGEIIIARGSGDEIIV